MRRKHRKKRKLKVTGLIIVIVFLLLLAGGSYFGITKYLAKKEHDEKLALKKEITSHYNEIVITNKKTDIYDVSISFYLVKKIFKMSGFLKI